MLKTSGNVMQSFQDPLENVIFLTPSNRISSRFSKSNLRKFFRYVELHLLFPFKLIFTRLIFSINRLLIVDHSDSMHLFFFKKNTGTVIVHDQFAYLAAHSKISGIRVRNSGKVYQALIHLGLKRAHKFLAVSEYTKNILVEFNLTQRIETLHLSWNPWKTDSTLKKFKNQLQGEYAILVSPYSWRKNRPLAINCILQLRKFVELKSLNLCIVGDELSNQEISEIDSSNLEFISIFQDVSDLELRNLFERSKFCIVTSKFEGYGLPILEANSLGVPCIHNELPSFLEITNSRNLIIREPLELNDWSKISLRVSGFKNSKKLASETDQNFGLGRFRQNLRHHFLS